MSFGVSCLVGDEKVAIDRSVSSGSPEGSRYPAFDLAVFRTMYLGLMVSRVTCDCPGVIGHQVGFNTFPEHSVRPRRFVTVAGTSDRRIVLSEAGFSAPSTTSHRSISGGCCSWLLDLVQFSNRVRGESISLPRAVASSASEFPHDLTSCLTSLPRGPSAVGGSVVPLLRSTGHVV